jgi:hypothetical protein
LNDDPLPGLTISDGPVREGSTGAIQAVFTVRLSEASDLPVYVDYRTADGTALGGSDYAPQVGRVQFPPGTTSRQIQIAVHGDALAEADETFFVRLGPATNAVLADAEGTATILNDDGAGGEVAWFEWSPLASPQYAGWPFAVMLTARDVAGSRMNQFNGAVILRGVEQITWFCSIGADKIAQEYPFGTDGKEKRTQVIYLAWDIGSAGRITWLALEAATGPGQDLSDWTIRMKHTPRFNFSGDCCWESGDWRVVLQTNLSVTATGWVAFPLTVPFAYNGVDNLMLDFSFDNDSTASGGYCFTTYRGDACTLYYQANGDLGDPLTWSGNISAPRTAYAAPNLQLGFSERITYPVQPAVAGKFGNGVWTGDLTLLEPGTNILLVAEDAAGHTGVSLPLTVEPGIDADADGLPDAWEVRYFGSTSTPGGRPNDDPDADGLTNLAEFGVGTDPRDASSRLQILAVELSGNNVRLCFTTAAGKRYQLEWTDDLSSPVWVPASEPLIGTGSVRQADVAGGVAQPMRFYRVRAVP